MKVTDIAVAFAICTASGAHAQLLPAPPDPVLQSALPTAISGISSYSPFFATSQGLPPGDPQAWDLYRPDPKLSAGFNLNPYLSIETAFVNAKYRDGVHAVATDLGSFLASGPRLAQGMPLGATGFDAQIATRLTVPVNDRLSAYGKLGILTSERMHHAIATTETGPAAAVGVTYQRANGETVTAELPVGPGANKAMNSTMGMNGARLKLGF